MLVFYAFMQMCAYFLIALKLYMVDWLGTCVTCLTSLNVYVLACVNSCNCIENTLF